MIGANPWPPVALSQGGRVTPSATRSDATSPHSAVLSRVLVVDDEVGIRRLMLDLLTDEGYEVRGAQDGLAALDVLRGWTPDVILLDMSMPRMSGEQFLDARRDQGLAQCA